MTAAERAATDEAIDTAILNTLAAAGGADRPVRRTAIARRVPGTSWQSAKPQSVPRHRNDQTR
jgi:hypothetical protein